MSELKITIDQLKNYLGTGLKYSFDEAIWDCDIQTSYFLSHKKVKPICYRLSDLDKFIPELGFVPLDEIAIYSPSQKDYLIDEILRGFVEHIIFDMILKWHFWPFGDEYFEKGLVIDKLKNND